MPRRPSGGSGRDGDIGLADAAIAVLGPVAFLWIVFQTVAVLNSEPPDMECRSEDKLSTAERATVVADLKDWYRNLQDAVKRDKALLQASNCPAPATPAVYANDVEPLRRHRICHNSDSRLIGEAGLTAGNVERLLRERARLVAGLRACVAGHQPETGCQKFDPVQLKKAGDDLRLWHSEYRKQVEDDRKLAEKYCDQPKTPPPQIKPLAAPVFKSLKVCREQWPALVQAAQVSESEIDKLQQSHSDALHRLRGCVANETASRIERSIQFITCSTEFTSNDETGDSMSPDEVEASFEKIARAVLGNLAEGDRAGRPFSRIEVRGHTDERPIPPGKDCRGATTNAQLSSLRAHKFNEELLRAIERLAAGGDPGATRLLARLPRYHLVLDERRREFEAKRKVLERHRPKQPPPAAKTDSPPPFSQVGDRGQLAKRQEQLRQIEKQLGGIEKLREQVASLEGKVEELRLYAIGVGSDEPAYKDIEKYPDCSAKGGEAEQRACRYRLDRRIEFRFVREAGRN